MKGFNRSKVAPCAVILGGLLSLIAGGANAQAQTTSSNRGTASFSVSPTTLEFGSINVGATSPTQSFRVKNVGNASGSVVADINSTHFRVSGCAGTLRPTETCELSVSFSPRSVGSFSARLTVLRGSGSVVLKGTGVGVPKLSVAQRQLELRCSPPKGGAQTGSVRVSNAGSANLTNVTASFPSGGVFTADATGCPASLDRNASCAVLVTYAPVSKASARSKLTIGSSNGGSAEVVVSGSCPRFASP